MSLEREWAKIYKSYVDQVNYHDHWLCKKQQHMVKDEKVNRQKEEKNRENADDEKNKKNRFRRVGDTRAFRYRTEKTCVILTQAAIDFFLQDEKVRQMKKKHKKGFVFTSLDEGESECVAR